MSTANCKSCNWDEGWPICLRDDTCPFSPAPKPTESKRTPTPQPAAELIIAAIARWADALIRYHGQPDRAARPTLTKECESTHAEMLALVRAAAPTPPNPQALPELPTTSPDVFAALEWIDDFIARCNGDDRGACESVNVIRAALAQPPAEPVQAVPIPRVVRRLVDSHAGKSMDGRVRPTNPCITAREGIVIADYIVALQGSQRAVGQQEETK